MAEVNDNSSIQLFEDQKIRTAWDAEKEEWYFSIVDVVAVLTEQKDSRSAAKYWSVLKVRLKNEGSELTTNCSQLKMKAADGKRRLTDVANTEQLLRIIQSIPSKKAEPFKAWLAMVGKERIEETIDPEQAIDRALDTYLKKGYSEEWIHQRLLAIRIRNELTDEWKKRGVQKGKEYAILTDEISRAWSGMTLVELVQQRKQRFHYRIAKFLVHEELQRVVCNHIFHYQAVGHEILDDRQHFFRVNAQFLKFLKESAQTGQVSCPGHERISLCSFHF